MQVNKKSPQVPPLRPIYTEWEWQYEGNCVGMDVEIFFLPHGVRDKDKREREAKAKAICVGCPVINQCLEQALSVPDNYGVFGGTTPEERQAILAKRNNITLRIKRKGSSE